MSVVIVGKFKGDTAKFRQALTDRADEFAKIGESARTVGALHHRFAIGDGCVLIIDEWESVEHFEKFFANPDLQAFIGSVGAAPEPPEMLIGEAVSSSDQFQGVDQVPTGFRSRGGIANDTEVHAVVRLRSRSRATGKTAAMNLHHFFTLRDGKIAYYRGTEDTAQTEAVLRA